MFSRITKEFIRTHKFESDGLNFPDEKVSYRPRPGMKLPPSAEENFATLRIKITEIFTERYGKNFAKFESDCSISEAIMRKYLKGTRTITREALAKFCIGTRLTLEQSRELFTLQGHSLEPATQRFDFLVVNALQDGDDINIFYETCQENNLKIF